MPILKKQKYKSSLCNNRMTFQECELAILRNAVDESEHIRGEKIVQSEEIKEIIHILEEFLIDKKLICYGGTAINNILPKYAQFYNRNVEIPDYDFFSPDAINDAKHLADLYSKAGYNEVEAKAGMHLGTYKVYVNFIPIADITYLNPKLYKSLEKEALTIEGIRYAPPNYLRMSMFLELSRPEGDTSRWEKVLKRMNLLNMHYPLKKPECSTMDFQREMESVNLEEMEKYYFLVRNAFIDQGVIFFGGYASILYSKYMPKEQQMQIQKIPDFDVLSEDPKRSAELVKEKLLENDIKTVKIVKHDSIGEIIPEHYEILIGIDTLAFIYKPIACHSYNKIHIEGKEINVATIDTMLSFYLAFLYADRPYYDKNRILCISMYLFEVEMKNRLEQKGLLKRFTLSCYGKQTTLEEIRAEKARKYEELSLKKNSKEYDLWFLKYNPKKTRQTKKVDKKENVKSVYKKEDSIVELEKLIPSAFANPIPAII